MYTINKEFNFSASHQLNGLEEGHPCGRNHGHNYVVKVVLRAETLDERGFVRDYGELSIFKEYIDSTFDHQYLNDILDCQPSAENIARHFYEWCIIRWSEVFKVGVSETPKTWAEYSE